MADRSGLKLVGFVFSAVTLAVMLTAGAVVYGNIDGRVVLDPSRSVTATMAPRPIQ